MKALITGATSGLGRAIAQTLSDKGWELVLTGRNEKILNEMKKNMKTRVHIIVADLSDSNGAYKVYSECRGQSIDLLVNNAGTGVFGEFCKTSLKNEMDMINVNLVSLHILTKLFLRDFLKVNRGHILNISSGAGFMSGPLFAGYYATKSYVTRLSLSIAEELRHRNTKVRISVFCPGPIDTDFNKKTGIEFSVRPKSAEYMAEYVISAVFRGKTLIIPSFSMKSGVIASRILPEGIIASVNYHIQKGKLKGKNEKNII